MSSKPGRIDRLLSEAEEILTELDGFDHRVAATESAAETTDPARLEALKRFRAIGELVPVDGYVEVVVAADEMSANIDFHPASEGMAPISLDQVNAELERLGVVYGVDWEAIHEHLFRCNTEHQELLNIEIARGLKPTPEIPEHVQLNTEIFGAPKRAEPKGNQSVDHREVRAFTLVRAGDLLGTVIQAQSGVGGVSVRGTDLPHPRRMVRTFKAGAGTVMEEGCIRAAQDGTVEVKDGRVVVNQTLIVANDVDYHTGHIAFPGDVVIQGHVREGFRIRAGGSMFCEQTVDVTDIEVAEDLTVKRGLIGRKNGALKVQGALSAKFIENCYVEAAKSVNVDSAILQSHIYTRGKIEVGSRGVIVGGKLFAQDGVSATQIGSATGPKTEIICGMDYAVNQKLEWIRDQTIRIATKLNEIRAAKVRAGGQLPAEVLELETKLQAALRRMNLSASELVFNLDKNDAAMVVVRGAVYPGTYVEICHVSYVVHRVKRGVVFKLDKMAGKITVSALSRS